MLGEVAYGRWEVTMERSRFHMPGVLFTHPEMGEVTPVEENTTPALEPREPDGEPVWWGPEDEGQNATPVALPTCDSASVTAGDACPEDCTTDPGENTLERDFDGVDTIVSCPYCGWGCIE